MGCYVYYDYMVTVVYPLLGINLLRHRHEELEGPNANRSRRKCWHHQWGCSHYRDRFGNDNKNITVLYQTLTSIWKSSQIEMYKAGLWRSRLTFGLISDYKVDFFFPFIFLQGVPTYQGCQTQFLEGRSPAEFSSNPAPTHKPCSFQWSLKDLISWIRCF